MPVLLIPVVWVVASTSISFGIRIGTYLAEVVIENETKRHQMEATVSDYYAKRDRANATVVE
jgi:hypothetical protein